MQRISSSVPLNRVVPPATSRLVLLQKTVDLKNRRLDHAVPDTKQTPGATPERPQRFELAATHTAIDSLNSVNVQRRLKQSCMQDFPEKEIKLRVELAAAYRLFAYLGWVEAIYNHLTVEVTEPDGSKAYLINPLGLRFDEITASSLLKIDADGNIKHAGVIGDLMGVNRAGWIIHGGIHMARGDTALSVMHSHHQVFTGIAATKTGFLGDISQTSETLGDVAVHDFEGLVVDEGERTRMVRDIGDRDTLLLRNHGLITMGKSIGAAWYRMYLAARAAEIQVAAQSAASAGGGILHPEESTKEKTREALKYFQRAGDFGTIEFTAYMRLMDKIDSSYRT